MNKISEQVNQLKNNFAQEINNIKNSQDLNNIKNIFLKKNTKNLYANLKEISDIDEKKKIGEIINNYKKFIEEKTTELESKFNTNTNNSKYDISIIKDNIKRGSGHPLIKIYQKIEKFLVSMGFSVVQGPEIELDKYNFEMLNMPSHHPARDMQDTFYINMPNILLRSHTSSVQIRTMLEKKEPPIQIISPGTVYRVDDIDPQHTPMFYQIEGLMIGEKISFANLKYVLINLIKEVFGGSIKTRFRPTYYPYTEPSAAMDMSCPECNSRGCRTCGNSGWITVLGSGMVHPNVLQGVNYDTSKYTGFAFGLGLNRLALIYYNLGEIRKLYENDINIWSQLN